MASPHGICNTLQQQSPTANQGPNQPSVSPRRWLQQRKWQKVTFAYFHESWMIIKHHCSSVIIDHSIVINHDVRFNPPEKWTQKPLMATIGIKCLGQSTWKTERLKHSKIHCAENLTETTTDSDWVLVTTSLNAPELCTSLRHSTDARPTLSRSKRCKLWPGGQMSTAHQSSVAADAGPDILHSMGLDLCRCIFSKPAHWRKQSKRVVNMELLQTVATH